METLYYSQDYVIREMKMPDKAHGCIVMDEDGRANIYINESDLAERQKMAVRHEMIHHVQDDLYAEDGAAVEMAARMRERSAAVYDVACGNVE